MTGGGFVFGGDFVYEGCEGLGGAFNVLVGVDALADVAHIAGGRPAVAGCAWGDLEGDGRVGADVDVAARVNGGGERGEVAHMRAEAVEQDYHRVGAIGVVVVGVDG